MAKTGTLLTDEERGAFGSWLLDCVKRSGVSHNAIARVLSSRPKDELSTAIVTRYFGATAQLPTPRVLAKIAVTIDVPWPVAFWRAGYFAEVLAAIDAVAGDGVGPERLEIYAIDLALCAFPRRGAIPSSIEVAEHLERHPLGVMMASVTAPTLSRRGLRPLLAGACEALEDVRLPVATRRIVAAEYVHAWADAYDAALADELRDRTAVPIQALEEIFSSRSFDFEKAD